MIKKVIVCAALLGLAFAGALHAQAPTIKRTILQKADIPEGKKFEVVLGVAELPAGVNIGRHTHPGIEQGTVVTGELTLIVEGQPDKTYKPGDSWQVPIGAVHDAKAGGDGAKVIVSYTVEKGLPLASPAK